MNILAFSAQLQTMTKQRTYLVQNTIKAAIESYLKLLQQNLLRYFVDAHIFRVAPRQNAGSIGRITDGCEVS